MALARRGVAVDALHGDLNQAARERVLARFRSGRLDVLLATDVAARGIDIDHITHVINFDMPTDTETYAHRIGRTGRVGRKGTAILLATPREKKRVRAMSRELKVTIEQVDVPSDADIARRRRNRLRDGLGTVLEEADLRHVEDWLAEVTLETGWTPQAIAAAAVELLASREGSPLGAMPSEEPPHWARPLPQPGAYPEPDGDVNEVRLFLPIGRLRGVRPQDVVGAIAGEAGIEGRAIGRIEIYDRKTFVGMSAATAETVLAAVARISIRGHEVRIAPARPPEKGPEPRLRRQPSVPPAPAQVGQGSPASAEASPSNSGSCSSSSSGTSGSSPVEQAAQVGPTVSASTAR